MVVAAKLCFNVLRTKDVCAIVNLSYFKFVLTCLCVVSEGKLLLVLYRFFCGTVGFYLCDVF